MDGATTGQGMTRIGVDIGGTFTDLVAVRDGVMTVDKVLSTPRDPAEALWTLVDRCGAAGAALVHGTTIATNALLERRGGRVVLCTTAGFEDLLWLRRQDRAHLYQLHRDHPPPLLDRASVIGVSERMGADGVVDPLERTEIDRVVDHVEELRPEAVAVSLLFAFRHAEHERQLGEALSEALPDVPVVLSSEVVPLFREFERTSTVCAEAYLRPRIGRYVSGLASAAPAHEVRDVRVMASNGGTMSPHHAAVRATALALSGPAGGVVGAQAVARAIGVEDVLTIDMGGTSADASLLLGGEPLRESSGGIGGTPLLGSTISIDTVSAGGGSIAWVDGGGALKVGPHSAGADPGPACYGAGGTAPTVTDALLVLGWLDAAHPLASDVRLDVDAACAAVDVVANAASLPRAEAAAGIVRIAAAAMARSLKHVSVRRGIDPRRMALLPFGGAGPLFGCLLAEELGLTTVVVPPHPGVLSAVGLAAAPERMEVARSVHRDLEGLDAAALRRMCDELGRRVDEELPNAALSWWAECRFAGQGYEVPVSVQGDVERLKQDFVTAHARRFGHGDPTRPVELVALRAVGERAGAELRFRIAEHAAQAPASVTVGWGGEELAAMRYPLEGLAANTTIAGPALFAGGDATAFVAPGWTAVVHATGALIVRR